MAKKLRVTVALDPEILRRTDRLAKAKRRSRSDVVQEALKDHIDQTEGMILAMENPTLRQAFVSAFGRPEVVRQFAEVMGEKLSDKQMNLFARAMNDLAKRAP